ncbi:MAG: 50S ribosomal protein L6 [Candidatus Wildermuthbacteria bacterium]|nr:50S ribosomal protein L6 [Candidatus Wildermuthbacteria bacterium]
MSRIGKKVIEIPSDVKLLIEGSTMQVTGPKGSLSSVLHQDIGATLEGNLLRIAPKHQELTKQTKALWGTSRQLIANMIKGVKEGYEKKMEIEGVGYRAAVQGQELNLEVGFTEPVKLTIPEGVTVLIEKNIVTVSGIDKANRKTREAEPYKGKGIKYVGEQIRRKLGKRAAATTGTASK